MEDIPRHGTFILHSLKDLFLRKKSAKDDIFKIFEFISPTISTCVQHIVQGLANLISTRILEDLLHGSKPLNYGALCMCMAG